MELVGWTTADTAKEEKHLVVAMEKDRGAVADTTCSSSLVEALGYIASISGLPGLCQEVQRTASLEMVRGGVVCLKSVMRELIVRVFFGFSQTGQGGDGDGYGGGFNGSSGKSSLGDGGIYGGGGLNDNSG